VLDRTEGRVSGFAGCNQITGSYEVQGDALQFLQMAMTRKACPQGMDLERQLGPALEEVRGYTISGSTLELRSEDGGVILRFETEAAE
jgi:heat shock protein HslJ